MLSMLTMNMTSCMFIFIFTSMSTCIFTNTSKETIRDNLIKLNCGNSPCVANVRTLWQLIGFCLNTFAKDMYLLPVQITKLSLAVYLVASCPGINQQMHIVERLAE